ncbi:acetylcholinesterase [Ixodes scapularis]
MKITALVVFCLAQIFLACSQNTGQDIVTTKSGLVRGTLLRTTTGQVRAFLGIPFAEAPVGDLRFKKPEPKQPWNYVYNATSLPKMCSQPSVHLTKFYQVNTENSVSEDCLFLNVFVPISNCTQMPVVVYIHGGAFTYGGISMNITDTTELSVRGDLITVAIAYRLGAFGFLRTSLEDVNGNMGLYDQALAIRWVKDNIKSFGGDPNKITLMGQSAGSISIGLHLLSPISRGLFHRAIMQSGSPFTRVVLSDDEKARSVARKLADALGYDIFFSLGSMYKVADNFTADDVKAAENLIHIISTFSKTGIPQTLEAVPWPRFQDEEQFMDLSVESYSPKKGIFRSECDFWKSVLPFKDSV